MQIGRKIKSFAGIVAFCATLMMIRPAQAFLWFTIDIAEISSIINDITNGMAKVTGAVAEIKNYTATIEAIGNPRDLIEKYSKEIKSSLLQIKSSVTSSFSSINKATSGIVQAAKDVNTQITDNSAKEKENTKITTKDVETAINTGKSEEFVLARIEKTKETIELNNREDMNVLKLAQDHVKKQTDESQEVIDKLVVSVIENGDLDNKTKDDLKNQAKQVEEKVGAYNKHAKDILENLQDEVTEKNKAINHAYDDYGSTVQDYYKGNVKQDALVNAGKKLNDAVQTHKVGIKEESIKGLTEESKNISEEITKLKEAIFDNISNNKEYSDEDSQEDKVSILDIKKNNRYAYHNRNEHRNFYLKGIYADESDKSFLLSYELGSDTSSKCKELNFEDIENNKINRFIENLRDCVVRAKVERDYFCSGDEDLMAKKCDPYEIEEKRFNSDEMKTEGVYKHIVQDYAIANTGYLDSVKQFVSTWLDLDTKNPNSTLKKHMEQIEKSNSSNINDQHNSEKMISLINLEAPKLWSLIRRADALMRAKAVVDLFRQQDNLYIDERDEDFAKSEEGNFGLVSEGDDGNIEVNVISNVILYGCGKLGKDISVKPEEKYEEEKALEAENNIKDCLYQYAEGASRGTINGKADDPIETTKEKWRTRKDKAYNDSMFYTFALSTINNYKSSLDYKNDIKEGDKNIITLQKNIQSTSPSNIIDDYASGAEIINYTTRQLASIIDADAQNLQSEILSDLRTIGYDYFDKTVEKDGGVQ